MDIKLTKLEKEDPRPKRTISADNNITLHTTGINTDNPHYYVRIDKGLYTEVSKEIFDFYDAEERTDHKEHMKKLRYEECVQLETSEIEKRAIYNCISAEEYLINKETEIEDQKMINKLYEALETLSEKSRNRIIMKYFENLSIREIARIENINFNAARKSIMAAEEKIKKFLEK